MAQSGAYPRKHTRHLGQVRRKAAYTHTPESLTRWGDIQTPNSWGVMLTMLPSELPWYLVSHPVVEPQLCQLARPLIFQYTVIHYTVVHGITVILPKFKSAFICYRWSSLLFQWRDFLNVVVFFLTHPVTILCSFCFKLESLTHTNGASDEMKPLAAYGTGRPAQAHVSLSKNLHPVLPTPPKPGLFALKTMILLFKFSDWKLHFQTLIFVLWVAFA